MVVVLIACLVWLSVLLLLGLVGVLMEPCDVLGCILADKIKKKFSKK
nr:MAG TPA: hypothetical protein [Siphoviridae sp. ctcOR4]